MKMAAIHNLLESGFDGIMFFTYRKMCAQTPMKLSFYTCERRFTNKIENAQTHLLIGSFNYSPSCTVALFMLQYLQTLCLHMYSSTPARLAVVDTSLYVIYNNKHRGGNVLRVQHRGGI